MLWGACEEDKGNRSRDKANDNDYVWAMQLRNHRSIFVTYLQILQDDIVIEPTNYVNSNPFGLSHWNVMFPGTLTESMNNVE
jgi:hypothetical protein